MNRKALALALTSTVLSALPASALPASARYDSPPVPPGVGLGSAMPYPFASSMLFSSFDYGTTHPNPLVTPAIHVDGTGSYLWDVDVRVTIQHARCSDVRVYLVGPNNREVTLTTNNGGYNSILNNVWFDDSALPLVTAKNGPVTEFVPEGALGSLIGIDPRNTDWTLRVVDDVTGESGLLVSWSLMLTTLPSAPATGPFGPFGGFIDVNSSIPDNGFSMVVSLNLPFSSGDVLSELRVFTEILHPDPRELEITLLGGFPIHKLATLREVRLPITGAATPDVFNGTTWFDGARAVGNADEDRPCSDEPYASNVIATELVPEGALSPLIGSDLDNWRLSIQDKKTGNVGQLVRWGVTFWTFDPPPFAGACVAGTNSYGCTSALSATGTADSDAGSGYTLRVDNINGAVAGLLFYGITGPKLSAWGPTSTMCVKAPVQRTPVMQATGLPEPPHDPPPCNGSLQLDWNQYYATHPTALGHPYAPGLTVDAQFWWRDAPGVKTSQLSNVMHFTVQP